MIFRTLPLAKLKRAKYNPRKISDAALAKLERSIDEFGLVEPIVVNKKTGYTVVGGHQRLRILEKRGEKSVECVVLEITPEKERLLNVALNNQNLAGEFDLPVLAELLKGLETTELDLSLSGFDPGEIMDIHSSVLNGTEEEDTPVEVADTATTQTGDLWELGRHRLLCGDARQIPDRERILAGAGKLDVLIADPPYGIDILKGDRAIGASRPFGKNRLAGGKIVKVGIYKPMEGDREPFDPRPFVPLARQAVFFGANYYAERLPSSSAWLIWDKKEEMDLGDFGDAELAWTNLKGAVRIFHHRWIGMVKASEHGERRVHPTQKPIALMKWCLEKTSGETIFDPYAGSGTVMIAAEKLARICLAIESEPVYVDAAVRRWQKMTGKAAKNLTRPAITIE